MQTWTAHRDFGDENDALDPRDDQDDWGDWDDEDWARGLGEIWDDRLDWGEGEDRWDDVLWDEEDAAEDARHE